MDRGSRRRIGRPHTGTAWLRRQARALLRRRAGLRRLWPADRRDRRFLLQLAVAAVVLLLVVLAARGVEPEPVIAAQQPRGRILAAIRAVESSDRPDPPDGDGGLAIGPYQIHEPYWHDAVTADPTLGGSYQDCRRRDYAERVIAAYMQRWVPKAWATGNAEIIARVHNGGPTGHRQPGTLPYWRKVQACLRRAGARR